MWSEMKHVMACLLLLFSPFLFLSQFTSSSAITNDYIFSINHNHNASSSLLDQPAGISAHACSMEGSKQIDSSLAGMNNPFQTLIQAPAEFFATLMTTVRDLKQTVESLQQNVDELQRDNATISSELRGVREREDRLPGFFRFPLLPTEIRRMIWTLAFRTPQLHILGSKGVTLSSLNAVKQANQEANNVGEFILKASFRLFKSWGKQPPLQQYVNFDLDTVWLDNLHDVPDQLWIDIKHYNIPLRRLALDLDYWEDPTTEHGYDGLGSVSALGSFKNVELLLVVDRPPKLSNPSKIVFIKPRETPYNHRNSVDIRHSIYISGPPVRPDFSTKWQDMARRVEGVLTEYKEKRAADRKKVMEGERVIDIVRHQTLLMLADHGVPEEALGGLENFHDLSDWKIPSVRYVEAIETDDLWIQSLNWNY